MPILGKRLFSFDTDREDFIHNFSLDKDKGDRCLKALLNGIALSINHLVSEFSLEEKINCMYIGGGLSKFDYLVQVQSSISNIEIIQDKNSEHTLLGIAFLMGLYKNIFRYEDIKKMIKNKKIYIPKFDDEKRIEIKNIWDKYFFKTV